MSENYESFKALISNAENYIKKDKFGKAFFLYLCAYEKYPELMEGFESIFIFVLERWSDILSEKKKYKELCNCYNEAMKVLPLSSALLNNFGYQLLSMGHLNEAVSFFSQSLSVNPEYLRAQYNLNETLNMMVTRWHFPILNDRKRNEAFQKAILNKIRKGFDRVLDIGTGSGLLSLFCSEGNAKEIYACDHSKTMVEIADEVFKINNISNVRLINKNSNLLQIPDDLPEKVSMVVSETIDCGLFGEGFLKTILFAWENFLLPPVPSGNSNPENNFGCVIPQAAILYVAGIECDYVFERLYLNGEKSDIKFGECEGCSVADIYDSGNLKQLNFKYLTKVEEAARFDFNNPEEMKKTMAGEIINKLSLKATNSGRLDCFAAWFDLILDDDIVINTGPESDTNYVWDQALFLLPKVLPLQPGQDVRIDVLVKNGILHLKSTGKIEAAENLTGKIIQVINDQKLTKAMKLVHKELSNIYKNSIEILEFCQFPIFGLNFLKTREKIFKDKLWSYCLEDDKFTHFCAKKNGLESSVTVYKDFKDIHSKKFDVVILHLFDDSGEMTDFLITKLNHMRNLLKPGGILIPKDVVVYGQFIHSLTLNKNSVVSDENTCGYKIAEIFNTFKVNRFCEILYSSLEKTIITEPFELFRLSSAEHSFEKTVPCLTPGGTLNALIYWYGIQFMDNVPEMCTYDESHVRLQAGILFPDTQVENEIRFKVVRNDGLFSVFFNYT